MTYREFLDTVPRNPVGMHRIDLIEWFKQIISYNALSAFAPEKEICDAERSTLHYLLGTYQREIMSRIM